MNRKKIMNPAELLCLLVISMLPGCVLALSTDANQPINIEADKLVIDESQHISRYTGNVKMLQGSMDIRADLIIFHFSAENDLQKLEIVGTPATFVQVNDKQQTITGQALRMDYFENKSILELNGEARVVSDRDTIESDHITLNTQTDALQAGDPQGNGRVRMLIQPKNSNPQ